MNPVLHFLLFILLPGALAAQFTQASQAAGYAESVYFDLETRTSTAVDHTSWDIAFTVSPRGSGVLINEGVASSFAIPLLENELYATSATDFATADTTMITERLYNGQGSWEEGGFNAAATEEDPLDLGWGSYSPQTQTVQGTRVFFVTDRDGVYHKVQVQALASGTYTFIHGAVTATAGDTVTIAKADFPGKSMAYFSFADGALDLEPASWDLLFTRYVTPLPDGDGNILDYTVTGVLQNAGVGVARRDGVDPETEPVPFGEGVYQTELNTIGYDWKSFDLDNFAWSIPTDRVYFVETQDTVYRLQFIDFEGSSTGVTTMLLNGERSTATADLPAAFNAARLYPNPASDRAVLEVDSRFSANDLRLEVIDATGRTLTASRVPALHTGTNRLDVPLGNLPAGHYFVRLSGGANTLTQHLIKQ